MDTELRNMWFGESKAPDWFIEYMLTDTHLEEFIISCVNSIHDYAEDYEDYFETDSDVLRDDAKHYGQEFAQDELSQVVDYDSACEFIRYYFE